jgi:hypothetical protein
MSKSKQDPFLHVGSIATGTIKRRAPKNISISRGLYDGPGGLPHEGASIEEHLCKIEWAAASAIRNFAATPSKAGLTAPAEIWRFLAWQAARTPAWLDLVESWTQQWGPGTSTEVVEPPPKGIENISDRPRPMCVEHIATGERRELSDPDEFRSLLENGWKWVLRKHDHLEIMHMQAWYFQVRHFPRFSWIRLDAPRGDSFVTSDRSVAWIVDGLADTPPASLRHPSAEIFAPLTASVALVGRHSTDPIEVPVREVNRMIASAASQWIAGPTEECVRQALTDRPATLGE